MAAALVAGFIDAIAGGGGLISVPSLLAIGLPPHLALGTNKGQSIFGTGAALTRYARAGLLNQRAAAPLFLLSLAGAWVGATVAIWLRPDTLRPIVLVLLVGVTPLVLLRPKARPTGSSHGRWAPAALALGMGAYDGFFGPGTGTLILLGLVALGRSPLAASAEAKVINLASNLAAVTLFAIKGLVVWKIALPMAVAQLAGGQLGAHTALRGGDRMVRVAMAIAVAALIVKIGHDATVNGASHFGCSRPSPPKVETDASRESGPSPDASLADFLPERVASFVAGGAVERGPTFVRRRYRAEPTMIEVTIGAMGPSGVRYDDWLRMSADYPDLPLGISREDGAGFYDCSDQGEQGNRCDGHIQLRRGLHLELMSSGTARRADLDALLGGLRLTELARISE
jgi:uncharacterized membrane protein YfcA